MPKKPKAVLNSDGVAKLVGTLKFIEQAFSEGAGNPIVIERMKLIAEAIAKESTLREDQFLAVCTQKELEVAMRDDSKMDIAYAFYNERAEADAEYKGEEMVRVNWPKIYAAAFEKAAKEQASYRTPK